MRDLSFLQGAGTALLFAAMAFLAFLCRTTHEQAVTSLSGWLRATIGSQTRWLAAPNPDLTVYRAIRIALVGLLPIALTAVLDIGTMRLWPTILIYAGCAAVATGVVWHLLAPATTAADRESPPVASAPVPPPAIQPSVNQPPSPPSTPPAVDPSSDQKTIEWLFPQFVMAGSAEALFFTVSGSAGYFVMRYRLQGINRTKEFLTSVRARVIPKNSGIPILLQFEIEPGSYADTDRARGVPPGATFTVAGRVLGSHRGDERVASVSEYLERYGGFTFEFECDELPKFTHSFSYSEVSEMLLLAERKNTEAYTPPPRVQLKP